MQARVFGERLMRGVAGTSVVVGLSGGMKVAQVAREKRRSWQCW